MLNLSEIAARIASPEACSPSDIADLQHFSEKYPYAQVFPILYLKALASSNDIRFDEELTKYAYRISDREQLYELIKTHQNQLENDSLMSAAPENVSINEISETNAQLLTQLDPSSEIQADPANNELLLPEEAEIESGTEWILEELDTVPEEEFEEEEIPLHFHEENESVAEESENTKIHDSFEKELLSEAISTSYLLHVTETSVAEKEQENTTEIELEKETNLPIETTQDKKIGLSFTSWLHKNTNTTSTQNESNQDKEHINSLVEQFIRDEPSIQRPKKGHEQETKPKREFFSATKKAKESLDSAKAPVSETLAKIFAVQGNYPKAIEAYEHLILSNPEKKTLFASQIKELKKKLNS